MDQRLNGEVEKLDGEIEGELVSVLPSLEGVIEADDGILILSGDLVIQSTTEVEIPLYDGSYEVSPLARTEVILPTTGKRMEDDVVVLEIPYYETTNESGGYTVIIG